MRQNNQRIFVLTLLVLSLSQLSKLMVAGYRVNWLLLDSNGLTTDGGVWLQANYICWDVYTHNYWNLIGDNIRW